MRMSAMTAIPPPIAPNKAVDIAPLAIVAAPDDCVCVELSFGDSDGRTVVTITVGAITTGAALEGKGATEANGGDDSPGLEGLTEGTLVINTGVVN